MKRAFNAIGTWNNTNTPWNLNAINIIYALFYVQFDFNKVFLNWVELKIEYLLIFFIYKKYVG